MSLELTSQKLKEHYTVAGEETSVLEKTYLSSNTLARMLWQRRANVIFKTALPIWGKGVVVDIGCGAGWYIKRFGMSGADAAIGVEISPGYLHQAMNFCSDVASVAFVLCDAAALPFADHSVDFVLISEVLEHLTYPGIVLSEVRRVLKRDGKVLVTVPSILNIELVAKMSAKIRGEFYEHLHSFTPWNLKTLMKRNGLVISSIHTHLFLPVPWLRLRCSNHVIEKLYNFVENILERLPGISRFGWTIIAVAGPHENEIA